MRSGFCAVGQDHLTHDRCRLDGCSCPHHVVEAELDARAATAKDESETPSLEDAVEVFVLAAEQVNRAALELARDPKPDDVLRRLHRLRAGLKHAQSVEAGLVRSAYLNGEHGNVQVDGLPPAKVTRGRDRTKWDERGVAQAVLDVHMAELGGVAPADPWTVVEWLLAVYGVQYVRVTPLREMGLEPEAFCDSVPGKISVQFIE